MLWTGAPCSPFTSRVGRRAAQRPALPSTRALGATAHLAVCAAGTPEVGRAPTLRSSLRSSSPRPPRPVPVSFSRSTPRPRLGRGLPVVCYAGEGNSGQSATSQLRSVVSVGGCVTGLVVSLAFVVLRRFAGQAAVGHVLAAVVTAGLLGVMPKILAALQRFGGMEDRLAVRFSGLEGALRWTEGCACCCLLLT